ncbi:MAG: hypothetical protein B6U97_01890 [Candidatus Altiarchaeales archaeon ex4484_96]|nr:MAG: hypothetical protein B6U97_01890 [Candidatus Altiarchaeales archaeon ex4484_96]
MIKKILHGYGRLVAKHPFTVLALVVFLTILGVIGNSMIQTETEDMAGRLPEDIKVIEAFNYVNDEFGGGINTGTIVVELDPQHSGNEEIRDVRDYRVIRYLSILGGKIEKLDEVNEVNSIANLVSDNGDIPTSENTIKDRLINSGQETQYISEDYCMTLLKLELIPDYEENDFYQQMKKIMDNTPTPPGIKSGVTGDFAQSYELNELIAPDMQKTSMISLAGILIILFFVVFRSVKNGIASLLAIVFGVIWGFGLIGWLGWSMSSVTSGAVSMIMGIGIDFGIQLVSRFKQEMTSLNYEEAMVNTIASVSIPMSTTTLAALIGFRAMSLGKLTFLADLGNMMSIGVLTCMIAAITATPTYLVIWEKYLAESTKKKGELNENKKSVIGNGIFEPDM